MITPLSHDYFMNPAPGFYAVALMENALRFLLIITFGLPESK